MYEGWEMRRLALNRCFIAATRDAFFGAILFTLSALAVTLQSLSCLAEGALAVSQNSDGGWGSGTAWNYQSKEEARGAAMQRCIERGNACRVSNIAQADGRIARLCGG